MTVRIWAEGWSLHCKACLLAAPPVLAPNRQNRHELLSYLTVGQCLNKVLLQCYGARTGPHTERLSRMYATDARGRHVLHD